MKGRFRSGRSALPAAMALGLSCAQPASPEPSSDGPPPPAEKHADPTPTAGIVTWTTLEPGLDFAGVLLPTPSFAGDSTLRVLRVDPTRWDLKLEMASETGQTHTAEGWLNATGAVAAINAAMFGADNRQGLGWMSTAHHVNNDHWAAGQQSLLVADPLHSGLAPFHLFNLGCESRADAEADYGTRVQSIRMLGCAGENVWSEQPRVWSAALIGEDHTGRALFLHVRSPYSMHALTDQLKALPLDLRALHYGEGGPEATLAIRTPALAYTWVGSWETGFHEADDNHTAWPVPNVIAVLPRAEGNAIP